MQTSPWCDSWVWEAHQNSQDLSAQSGTLRSFFQAMAESAPSSSPRTGARAYGEGTPASLFPHGHGRLERHFPRLPRWMVTNSRGRGLCDPCTVYHWLLLAALWRGLKAAWPQLGQEKHKCCWIALLLENVFANCHLPPICGCGWCVQNNRGG